MIARLFLYAVLAVIGYHAWKAIKEPSSRPDPVPRREPPRPDSAEEEMAACDQCGAYSGLDRMQTITHQGKTARFCSPACRDRWVAEQK